MGKILQTKNKATERTIAALAIRFAAEAAAHFEDVDEGDLRLQIASALLKSSMLPLIREKFFQHDDGSLVSRLFADGRDIPDTSWPGWDLV